MGFFGPSSLGGGDPASQGGDYDATLQRLLQQFPGLTSLSAPQQGQGTTTASLGFGSPGIDLYSGQATSAGGLFGSTGTGIFEGASAGQPESVTGGLSSGYLGKSPSQAALSNTGQPGTSEAGAPAPAPTGAGQFANLLTPSGLATTQTGGPVTDQNLLGAPAQSYDLLGPVKSVVGGAQLGQAFAGAPPLGQSFATPQSTFGGGQFDMSGPGAPSPSGDLGGMGPQGFGPGGTSTNPQPVASDAELFGGQSSGGGGFGFGQAASGLGGILGGIQAYQGIKGGNPLAALQGLYSLYSGANSALGLGLPGAAEGLQSLGTALGGTAAAGAQTAAEAGASAAGAGIMGGISAIPDVWEAANTFLPHRFHPNAGKQETENIRRDFATAWPGLQGAPQTLADLSTAQDPAALTRLLQAANYQVAQGPAVSHWLSTHGGEKHTMFYDAPALDTSQQEAVSPQYQMDAVLGETLALDRMAQQGMDVSNQALTDPRGPYNVSDFWGGGNNTAAVQSMLGQLWDQSGAESSWDPTKQDWWSSQTGLDPRVATRWNTGGTAQYSVDPNNPNLYQVTPQPWRLSDTQAQAFAQPGHRIQAISDLFSQLNPNFASSPLGATLAYLQSQG